MGCGRPMVDTYCSVTSLGLGPETKSDRMIRHDIYEDEKSDAYRGRVYRQWLDIE